MGNNSLSDTEFMEKAYGIIEVRFPDHNFGVTSLAHTMKYTREYMSRKFQDLSGVAPSDYIFRKRLDKAKELLCNAPEMNITQVSLESGFGSHAYFSKCFKAHYGMTPSGWRANCSGNGH